jgi:hypothetical protein
VLHCDGQLYWKGDAARVLCTITGDSGLRAYTCNNHQGDRADPELIKDQNDAAPVARR